MPSWKGRFLHLRMGSKGTERQVTRWGEAVVPMVQQKRHYRSHVETFALLGRSPLTMFYHLECDVEEN